MTIEELKNLKKHYRTVKEDAAREIARLKAEIQESDRIIPELEEKRIAAMKAADNAAYTDAKNNIEMHQERATAHTVSVINLEEGPLISAEEFNRMDKELFRLQARITNETAARFMKCIDDMKAIASEYEDEMRICDNFGKYLQEEIYRKRSPYDNNRIEARMNYGFNAFSRIVRAISAPGSDHSIDYSDIERRAANVLKAKAAARLGMKDKAKKAIEGE